MKRISLTFFFITTLCLPSVSKAGETLIAPTLLDAVIQDNGSKEKSFRRWVRIWPWIKKEAIFRGRNIDTPEVLFSLKEYVLSLPNQDKHGIERALRHSKAIVEGLVASKAAIAELFEHLDQLEAGCGFQSNILLDLCRTVTIAITHHRTSRRLAYIAAQTNSTSYRLIGIKDIRHNMRQWQPEHVFFYRSFSPLVNNVGDLGIAKTTGKWIDEHRYGASKFVAECLQILGSKKPRERAWQAWQLAKFYTLAKANEDLSALRVFAHAAVVQEIKSSLLKKEKGFLVPSEASFSNPHAQQLSSVVKYLSK